MKIDFIDAQQTDLQKIVATYVGLDHSSSVGRRTQKRNL